MVAQYQKINKLTDKELYVLEKELARKEREAAQASLKPFVRQTWPVLGETNAFLDNWHIELICEYLEMVSLGELTRLIINIPTRYMKSTLVSVDWPVWEWLRIPNQKWMFSSYSNSLSVKHSLLRRRILESAWFAERWGHIIQMDPRHNQQDDYGNTAGGSMFSTSMTGASTGLGGNRLVIDDPVDPEQAHSRVQRDTANREFDQKFYNRLDDKKKGAIVIVMQRVHEEDLTGHVTGLMDSDLNSYLIKSGEWLVLRVPAEAEQTEEIQFPLHPEFNFIRKEGDLLWESREGAPQIANARRVMGWGYSGQYQQRPSSEAGNIIKRSWIRYYKTLPLRFDYWLQAWDMSFNDKETSAYVCGGVLALKGAEIYLVDWIMERMDLPTTIRAVLNMSRNWPRCRVKLVEQAANGEAVVQTLRKKIPGLVLISPKGSKESRLYAVQPMFEAGNVLFPDPSLRSDVKGVLDQLCTFPASTYKDFVDMLAHGLNRYNSMQVRKQAKMPERAVAYGNEALEDANKYISA